MAENLPVVVFPPQPARNPVNQALECISSDTDYNLNSICDEGRLDTFDDFVGLTESDI